MRTLTLTLLLGLALGACLSKAPQGLQSSPSARTTVKFDFFNKPLPEIPLPNDIATRHDATSGTGRRINASMIAATGYEVRTRELIDQLDGWGVNMPIAVPFTGPLDIDGIVKAHPRGNFDLNDDVIYLVNVDRKSPAFGTFHLLDVGGGNYPVVLEEIDKYWKNDVRGWTNSLLFEEEDEDVNKNGVLDAGEDTDADGVLDKPNYYPNKAPARDDLAGRADALMTFYERETKTLLARPMEPLLERTTYAVVITRRLKDERGEAVGSPFSFINHEAQTEALAPLGEVLSKKNQSLNDVAFAFTFTTQSIESVWKAVRDGLYGIGVQKHLGEQFPAEISGLEVLRDLKVKTFEKAKNPYILHHEDWAEPLGLIASAFLGSQPGTLKYEKFSVGHSYVDFHVVGHFDSPQLLPRTDKDGRWLGLNDQSWPADLDRVPAPVRRERVYFHLVVPRKETSVRGEGKPAPLVILGHGYTGNRFDAVGMGGYFARQGVAVLAIDDVSHGIDVGPDDYKQAKGILDAFDLGAVLEATTQRHRAFDQNGDGGVDSGADFWTAYLFHTRDVVRQSALDYMQVVRILRAFDGKRRWALDVDQNGEKELAGDFDGDGQIDVGGDAEISMLGASLGGIMAAVLGGLEPELTSVVPIAAGGGLGDVAYRSLQGGVPQAVILRLMGPLFVGTQAAGSSQMLFETIIPDLNNDRSHAFATASGVAKGDFVVVKNLVSGERGCGYVWESQGTLMFRAGVESNAGDAIALELYAGDAMKLGSEHCEVQASAKPRTVIDTFQRDVRFQQQQYKQGAPLVTLAEGLGLRRATPRMRRFLSLAQLVLDPADPSVMVPFMKTRPFTYPGTGKKIDTNMLLVTTAGDMNVPANTGVAIARAAGLLDYRTPHPAYGKSLNQVLVDSYVVEAVDRNKRFTNAAGAGVIMDVENFAGGTDPWGQDIPRLDPPLRLGFDLTDKLKTPQRTAEGGGSAAVFPFPIPTGQHGFEFPGGLIDVARKMCTEAKKPDCDKLNATNAFDVGSFMFNLMARYLKTGGRDLTADACLSRDDCGFFIAPPKPREKGL